MLKILQVGAIVEVKNLDGAYQEAVINKLTDASWYTVGKKINFLLKMYFQLHRENLIRIKWNFLDSLLNTLDIITVTGFYLSTSFKNLFPKYMYVYITKIEII